MKYKTLFRLALKLFGVVLVVLSVSRAPYPVASIVAYAGSKPQGSNFVVNGLPDWAWTAFTMLELSLQFGIGLYLFFGGEWIVNKAIPSNRTYCHECGYLLKDLKGTRCPECDTPFTPHGSSTP